MFEYVYGVRGRVGKADMKRIWRRVQWATTFFLVSAAAAALAPRALALDGQVQIHDPSTVIQCDGKFYVYGTGGARGLISDDGWTWRRGYSPIQVV